MAQNTTTLSDKFSRRGLWWLPANPDHKIPGQISFDPRGELELELDGSLREKLPTATYHHFHATLVYGVTIDGKSCTLQDVHESSFQMRTPDMATSKCFFNQLIIGQSRVDPSATKYESALLEFSDFRGWMHRDPFTHETPSSDAAKQSVSYTMPQDINITVPALAADVSFAPSFITNMEYQQRTLTHYESVRIKPTEPREGEWYTEVVFKMRVLLSLLVGSPVVVKAFKLCTNAQQFPKNGEKWIREYVDLCVKQQGKLKDKDLLPYEIPFTYPLIAASMPAILNAWYAKSDQLSTLYGLFFGTTVNRSMPTEFHLLALIQALESYHRSLGTDQYVPDTDYENIRSKLTSAIPDTTPSDLRDALKARIKYGNEYSLRKRLDLTLAKIPDTLRDDFVQGNKRFVSQVVATRNYLTHRDETQKDVVLDFRGMFNAAVSLQLLVQYILLTELGIDHETVATVMREHWTYKNRPQIL